MKKIVKSGLELERVELSPEEAEKKLEEMNEPYKVELVKEHSDKGEHITFYKQGEFYRPLRRSSPHECCTDQGY